MEKEIQITGEASLYDFLGDLVVYRNLEPTDKRLPGLKEIWPNLEMESYRIPRKMEPIYAKVVLYLIERAQALRLPQKKLERLLYIGDTRMNDGTAIRNFRALGNLEVSGFICKEDMASDKDVEVQNDIFYANRWRALVDFLSYLRGEGFSIDEATVAVIDMDKTAIGARGRNDKAIDRARVEAVQRTVEEVLGGEFQENEFRPIYDELNQPPYHPFTADNQDNLAYISLMLSAGIYDFQAFLSDLSKGNLKTFSEFVEICGKRLETIGPRELRKVHDEVKGNLSIGDPTPFKSFRYKEYETTLAHMQASAPSKDLASVLAEDIVTTKEVADLAHFLREQGALLFTISDKPDEASVPRDELRARGFLPLHQIATKVVGTPIYHDLRRIREK